MNDQTRNVLRNTVTQCRRLLEEDVLDQLQGHFGIHSGGRTEAEDALPHLDAEGLEVRRRAVAAVEHIQGYGASPADAVDQFQREVAFTHLNRLCAFKMLERRGLLEETVSRGANSNGFKVYLADHPDDERLWQTGSEHQAYRNFLFYVCSQLSEEIKVLFDTEHVSSHLFPDRRALEAVLDLINAESLEDVWDSDETIGWIYQYFTPKEQREKARKESAAPRNSYELAFRNQFFTPRYVVEFLTDNTLGRTWYEMRKGQTKLAEQCQYLVRRPTEIFLEEGETPPPETETDTNGDLSQEDLLKQPVHVPHREKKLPWEIKVLDPAAGSGHFLLYAFDLLETIYEEAYDDPDIGQMVRSFHPDPNKYQASVPGMILRFNLHGIDIDLRSTQIASLALWLRAQRSYQRLGLRDDDRPRIDRANMVCAEPMPGDEALLAEFCDSLEPSLLGDLVREVWEKMQLAGEAGSLLKIEEEIRDIVGRAQEAWQRAPQGYNVSLFDGTVQRPAGEMHFDFSEVTGSEFWLKAETLLLDALELFASQATNGQGYGRQLFKDDARQGFAFIEMCRRRYDVVLMNPPFGASLKSVGTYLSKVFQNSRSDMAFAFVERALDLIDPNGSVGCLTTRTGFFLPSAEGWRRNVLKGGDRVGLCADLGYGVLEAMVETAAYTLNLGSRPGSGVFLDVLQKKDKQSGLSDLLKGRSTGFYVASSKAFENLPGVPFAYWAPASLLSAYGRYLPFEPTLGVVKRGVATGENERFLRLFWEVDSKNIGLEKNWIWYAKGGEYSPYFSETNLVIDWANDGEAIRNFVDDEGKLRSRPQNLELFFHPGLAYASRTTSGFGPRILQSGCGFDQTSNPIFVEPKVSPLAILSLLLTRPVLTFVELSVGSGDTSQSGTAARDYTNGLIGRIPIPDLQPHIWRELTELGGRLLKMAREPSASCETYPEFQCSTSVRHLKSSIRDSAYASVMRETYRFSSILHDSLRADEISMEVYELSHDDRLFIDEFLGPHPASYGGQSRTLSSQSATRLTTKKCFWADRDLEVLCHMENKNPEVVASSPAFVQARVAREIGEEARGVVSYALGCIMGRWDVRVAQDASLTPNSQDPFNPIPNCPPGMLVQANGLPARSGSIASEEWLMARPNAITLPPEGTVSQPTIPDSEYPLDVDWNGILVDDPDNEDDVVRRCRDVLALLWEDRAQAIEEEACEILGVKALRDYFRNPKNFWEEHVKRYSKSRRKAPIYWLLQSPRRHYALWLYYHRLDRDILYKALRNYVDPKHRLEESRLQELRDGLPGTLEGRERKALEGQIEDQEEIVNDVLDFKERLEKVAALGLDPDLNDGVVLNIASLHELIPWTEAKKYWDELLAGKYEWSTIGKQLREKGLVRG